MMEGWMITLIIVIAGLISSAAVTKHIVNRSVKEDEKRDEKIGLLQEFKDSKAPLLEHLSKTEDKIKDDVIVQGKIIAQLQQQISKATTMDDVRVAFVSKEMFEKVEKHIDKRFDSFEKKFDGIDTDLKEILSAVRGK